MTARLVPDGDGLALGYGPVEQAGPLTASIGARAVRFAANVDPQESDLVAADEQAFLEALDRPARIVSDATEKIASATSARAGELASLALYLVLALMASEMCMALWFGSSRKSC
jgi:hypothetical protein